MAIAPNNIPKVFWYSLSICILAITSTLCSLAWRSSTVKYSYEGRIIEFERQALDRDLKEVENLATRLGTAVTNMPTVVDNDIDNHPFVVQPDWVNRSDSSVLKPMPKPPKVVHDFTDAPEQRIAQDIRTDVDMLLKRNDRIQSQLKTRSIE